MMEQPSGMTFLNDKWVGLQGRGAMRAEAAGAVRAYSCTNFLHRPSSC